MDAGELLGENNVLKKRLQEQTQLFEDLDNDHQQEVQQLKQSNMELLNKVHMLEAKLTTFELNNAELNEMVDQLKLPGKPVPAPQPEIISTVSESFVADYDNLQDQLESLQEKHNKLEDAHTEEKSKNQELTKANEDLQKMNAEQQQMIKAMESTNRKLTNEIKECKEEIMCLRQQADMFVMPDAQDRGNSMFAEVDEARKKAEQELKSVVEQNMLLQAEIEQLQMRLRRFGHSNLSVTDQAELDFQRKHGQEIYGRLQEYIKSNETLSKENLELSAKLVKLEHPENTGGFVALLQRKLELSNAELMKLKKSYDDQSVKLHELNGKILEIPALQSSIKRFELKVASLQEEVNFYKEAAVNKDGGPKTNDENALPRPKLPELHRTPKAKAVPPQLADLSKTQPIKTNGKSSWLDALKKEKKQAALENPNRERSLEAHRRRLTRNTSLSNKNRPLEQ